MSLGGLAASGCPAIAAFRASIRNTGGGMSMQGFLFISTKCAKNKSGTQHDNRHMASCNNNPLASCNSKGLASS